MNGKQYVKDLTEYAIQPYTRHMHETWRPRLLLLLPLHTPSIHISVLVNCESPIEFPSHVSREEERARNNKKKLPFIVLLSPGISTLFASLTFDTQNLRIVAHQIGHLPNLHIRAPPLSAATSSRWQMKKFLRSNMANTSV